MSIGMNSSVTAIRTANTQMTIRAHNIANVNTDGYKSIRATQMELKSGGTEISSIEKKFSLPSSKPGPNDVDLAEEMTGMIPEEKSLTANVRAIQAKDRMLGDLLDLFA